jgi:uncharacterized membrane protein
MVLGKKGNSRVATTMINYNPIVDASFIIVVVSVILGIYSLSQKDPLLATVAVWTLASSMIICSLCMIADISTYKRITGTTKINGGE